MTYRRDGLAKSLSGVMLAALLAAVAPEFSAADTQKPVDRPYPGTIELRVDATNVGQRIFQVHESIPVKPGKVTLLYPEWRLGTHAPAGFLLSQFAGLMLHGNRQRLEWQRDPLDMYAFHVEVPAGVSVLDADFQFLSPVERNEGAILATSEMLAVHWEAVVLYPAGYYAHGVTVEPSLILPEGWQFAGALDSTGPAGPEHVNKMKSFDDVDKIFQKY